MSKNPSPAPSRWTEPDHFVHDALTSALEELRRQLADRSISTPELTLAMREVEKAQWYHGRHANARAEKLGRTTTAEPEERLVDEL